MLLVFSRFILEIKRYYFLLVSGVSADSYMFMVSYSISRFVRSIFQSAHKVTCMYDIGKYTCMYMNIYVLCRVLKKIYYTEHFVQHGESVRGTTMSEMRQSEYLIRGPP